MTVSQAMAIRALFVLPGLALAIFAIDRLPAARAVDQAFPIPVYITMNVPLPRRVYRDAIPVLAGAPANDGETHIIEAEAVALQGRPPADVLAILKPALANAPASPRGWLLRSEMLIQSDPQGAAAALSTSLELGPFEYYLAERQVLAAARLWPMLAENSKVAAARQAHVLWQLSRNHGEVRAVMRAVGGSELMQRAFTDDPKGQMAFDAWNLTRQPGRPPL